MSKKEEAPKVRDRIELVFMDDADPIPSGTKGTVMDVFRWDTGEIQVEVAWDNGRSHSVILPVDKIKIL